MFTSGQFIFAIISILVFIVILYYSYRGDKKLHKKYYKGSIWVLVGFILFIAFLVLMKTYLKD